MEQKSKRFCEIFHKEVSKWLPVVGNGEKRAEKGEILFSRYQKANQPSEGL